MQLEVLETAIGRFRDEVALPVLRSPRGEPRIRALFEWWLAWGSDSGMPGGCLITAAASELDGLALEPLRWMRMHGFEVATREGSRPEGRPT